MIELFNEEYNNVHSYVIIGGLYSLSVLEREKEAHALPIVYILKRFISSYYE